MGIRQSITCTALAHTGAMKEPERAVGQGASSALAVGQRDARSRLWGYRGRLRAEHLQELVLDSRKHSDIEKVEHVLHAAKQVG